MYSPSLSRWINRDPIGENGGVNLYAYVENSPVGSTDPEGLAPKGWTPSRKGYKNCTAPERKSCCGSNLNKCLDKCKDLPCNPPPEDPLGATKGGCTRCCLGHYRSCTLNSPGGWPGNAWDDCDESGRMGN